MSCVLCIHFHFFITFSPRIFLGFVAKSKFFVVVALTEFVMTAEFFFSTLFVLAKVCFNLNAGGTVKQNGVVPGIKSKFRNVESQPLGAPVKFQAA